MELVKLQVLGFVCAMKRWKCEDVSSKLKKQTVEHVIENRNFIIYLLLEYLIEVVQENLTLLIPKLCANTPWWWRQQGPQKRW
jgi:hypothetical protein